jgi:hypothetical protein
MRVMPMLVAVVAIASGATLAAADPPGGSPSGPRLPDGVPPGFIIPEQAGNQAFEFGNCSSRAHSAGGWMCVEPAPDSGRYRESPDA